ncbi:aldehyde ferredoxin oxidoreductase [Candidatus Vecturithrix granuli]|uniref:Aldehyde ferredoxin oxidoreductase n=1 Tax=Vecturithrix granuli TaxID=1499967 RepID=A0A0S6WAM9_VECG1|nr:aldehyde ferredoxin oxidoreductase [Candidatus Vecturithrix granuli]
MYGYIGTILFVNLTTGDIRREAFDEAFVRKFLGGNGFAAKIIYDTVAAEVDPFSEDNAVVFALGPFTGSPVWGSRGHVASISPQTGYFADSNFGGDFAAMLKKSGFDAVAITGKAASPVYLLLDDGEAVLKDASALWGKPVGESHRLCVELEGEGVESAVIGPAGENQVLFANIMCSGKRISAAGRGGIGAVLGSKNCKAVVVKGSKTVEVADSKALAACLKDRFPILRDNTKAMTNLGTPVLVNLINDMGKLATRNNTREVFEHAHDISGETIREHYTEKNVACLRCPVACGKLVRVHSGEFAGQAVKMPEYETIYAFGSMLENRDLTSIFNANTMCDDMGLDTISMGVTLAFTAECLEKGIVTADELGANLAFGDGANIPELVRLTALKQGAGALFALGSERLAERWGQDSRKYLYSVQGLEIAGHSARGIRSMGLAYATSTRGGSHHDARPNYIEPNGDPGFEGQAVYCVNSQHYTAFGDSLVVCRFISERGLGSPFDESIQEIVRAVTGWEMDLSEIRAIGERIYNLERLINVRRGRDRSKDTLPYRVTHEPINAGPSQGRYCPPEVFEQLLDEYYQLRGWDAQGIPTAQKLQELGL